MNFVISKKTLNGSRYFAIAILFANLVGCGDESAGNKVSDVRSINVVISDKTLPKSLGAPQEVRAIVSGIQEVHLSWEVNDDILTPVRYRVYRHGQAQALGETAATNFVDSSAGAPGSTPSYRISAVDAQGNVSPLTDPVSITLPLTASTVSDDAVKIAADTTPPSAVENFSVKTLSPTSTRLNWTASTDNVGVIGYRIYRTDGRGDSLTMRKFTTAGLEYIDNTTASNVAYTYYVASVDAAGNVCIPAGPWLWVRRSRVDIDAQAPDTPKDLKASAPDYKRVNLNWTASTDNVGVVKYLILRNGKQIAENASTSWSDTAVIGSTTYAYAVKAVDAANNTSAASAVVSVTTPTSPDAMPPTTPTNLIATAAGVTQVNLTWLASTDNVGVAKYEIYRDGSILNQTPSNTINYTDTSVMGNTSYSYQVKAVDAAGNKSGFSITITVKTPIPKDIQAPTAPTNLVGSTLTVSQVKLTWNASTDNIAVTKYRIYRVASPAYIAEVTTTSYDDNTVQADTSYSYTVKALDAENNMSFDSNVLTIKTGKVVNPPVVITKDVKNVTAMEGGIATFWAEATGVEPFTYKWYFENNSATDFIQICQGKKICTLNPVRPEHAGKYNVRITSPDGQSNAGAAGYLTVTPLATNPGISCDYQTVKTALATAVDGATILLKAETCDWKDFPALKRSAGIVIKGAGKDLTIIQRTALIPDWSKPNGHLFQFDCTNGKAVEISHLTLLGNDKQAQTPSQRDVDQDSGIALDNGCIDFKIHDARFEDFSKNALVVNGNNSNGVIYSNEFIHNWKCSATDLSIGVNGNCEGYGIGVYGDNKTWPAVIQLGTKDAVYIEDNTFLGGRHTVASNNGARYVFRHNVLTRENQKSGETTPQRWYASIDAHGASGNSIGTRSFEVYDNVFKMNSDLNGPASTGGFRGGDGVMFCNKAEAGPYAFGRPILKPEKADSSGQCPLESSPGVNIDYFHTIKKAFFWANTGNYLKGGLAGMDNFQDNSYTTCSEIVKEGRDYFNYAPSLNNTVANAKLNYSPFTYPHPLRNLAALPATACSW